MDDTGRVFLICDRDGSEAILAYVRMAFVTWRERERERERENKRREKRPKESMHSGFEHDIVLSRVKQEDVRVNTIILCARESRHAPHMLRVYLDIQWFAWSPWLCGLKRCGMQRYTFPERCPV